MRLPLVALVGRPNVGKSTLFNRIIGERLAIVEDVAGTTRDRLYAASDWAGQAFMVVDTGGLDMSSDEDITVRVRNQAQVAIDEADVIVLVTDVREGATAGDADVAERLRRSGKPVVLAANKADGLRLRDEAADLWSLGVGEPIAVSALHGSGSGDLLDRVVAELPAVAPEDDDERLKIAIVGRPNVGKSSLVNRLTGAERAIVSGTAGTTRDAIDSVVRREGEEVLLVDTAGIRRRGKIVPGIERYAVLRAMRAIDRSDVAVLMLDAADGITAQDAHVGGFIDDAGRGAIIALNKWDLVEKDTHTADAYRDRVRAELKFLAYAPIVFISALTGQRAVKIIDLAADIDAARKHRVPTAQLNQWLADVQARQGLSRKGRALKLRYATQVGVAPPRFAIFVNDTRLVHFSTRRYLENQLRAAFPFEGTPIRLSFRAGKDKDGARRSGAKRRR